MDARLSDAAILREVEDVLRLLGDGRCSLAAAGEKLIRRIIGLENEQPGFPVTDDAE